MANTYLESDMKQTHIHTDEFDMLSCPSCGDVYLHYLWTKDYGGETDDPREPFRGYGGLRIGFACEGCDAHIELVVGPRKGNTFVWMESIPEGRLAIRAEGGF